MEYSTVVQTVFIVYNTVVAHLVLVQYCLSILYSTVVSHFFLEQHCRAQCCSGTALLYILGATLSYPALGVMWVRDGRHVVGPIEDTPFSKLPAVAAFGL